MKNKQMNLLIVALILTGFAISCSMFGGANSNGNANSNGSSSAKSNIASSTPLTSAIEITPEALGKEFMSDQAAADAKYKGNVISFTAEVWSATQSETGEKIFITFENARPGPKFERHVKIECVSAATKEAKMIVEGYRLNEIAANYSTKKDAPQVKAVVKGTYERSVQQGSGGVIVLMPCEVSVF